MLPAAVSLRSCARYDVSQWPTARLRGDGPIIRRARLKHGDTTQVQ
jgi:hypothetical protein